MSTVVTVLYPADATFDMDYYLNTHMSLVVSGFTKHGYTSSQVATFKEGPYSVQAILNFETAEGLQAALAESGAEISADVPNFSNKPALIIVGTVVSK